MLREVAIAHLNTEETAAAIAVVLTTFRAALTFVLRDPDLVQFWLLLTNTISENQRLSGLHKVGTLKISAS
ncbi:hypothetical protein [Thermoleptolyngbya sp. C42_A2020_037]|uniref:hypothetical protein n=1 Tax=Thermoleptolyngbya sp. C42_A2020_037 TaxID=2747799 RepID=UPI0019E61531|nr:hypothetical protein [Thermoleptolyngbya sp. C42_A2020_037]MBF2083075.1 hypothetical protein [Thermoleptolyngbya sp. C42_A2020_037]